MLSSPTIVSCGNEVWVSGEVIWVQADELGGPGYESEGRMSGSSCLLLMVIKSGLAVRYSRSKQMSWKALDMNLRVESLVTDACCRW